MINPITLQRDNALMAALLEIEGIEEKIAEKKLKGEIYTEDEEIINMFEIDIKELKEKLIAYRDQKGRLKSFRRAKKLSGIIKDVMKLKSKYKNLNLTLKEILK